MSTVVKRELSGAADGKAVKVAATATPGTTIHTATSSTTAGDYDEIWLWAYNSHTIDVQLTIEFGGVTDPDNHIVTTVPFDHGILLVVPGLILQNSLVVKAYAGVASVITLMGYVNQYTD